MVDLIYKPKGKAGEYAAWACNIYRGCDHACQYCYAPNVLHMTREDFYKPQPRPNFLENLERECAKLAAGNAPQSLFETTPQIDRGKDTKPKQVLLCFTCDPYCNLDTELQHTRKTIEILHRYGMSVCVLTKGGTRALRDLDLFTPQDAFACTLTSVNEEDVKYWEPGAADTVDRMNALYDFKLRGIPTWVSMEPVLSAIDTLRLIEWTADYVDLYKIGMWNYDARANAIDWYDFGNRAVDLLERLGKPYIIKEDLRKRMEVSHA